ncbi:hypothetical protein EU805_02440 [Salipiger sp. IMCC34102]|uniref:YrhK family protein n=1 Tax=Salipiger sp. IMCC34102 TaxID=2510647 RepID=UPI00101DAA18|nr:YrhK family protein [Salipiger sp. IMCC34102]RYH04252.1 hypothetical protein EU805_02440 [Salipiger sp. IMCC34102]
MYFQDKSHDHPRKKRIYATYELAHTVVDLMAAICFVVGSALFFFPAYETSALWFFLIGSILFAVKPTLRFSREVHLARIGDTGDLAKRESAPS